MELKKISIVLLMMAGALSAAPQLRLTTTAAGPYPIAASSNGTTRIVEAYNIGDGALSLTATSSASWLSVTVGGARSCSARPGSCLPVTFTINASNLAIGTYTGVVTVSDPNALDAPQDITVTISVGGVVPSSINLTLPPTGVVTTTSIGSADALTFATSTQSGGTWLGAALDGAGTFRYSYPYLIRATRGSLSEGTYTGSVQVSGSPFAADNKIVPVTFRVTSSPVPALNPARLIVRGYKGSKTSVPLNVINLGGGSTDISATGTQAGTGGAPTLNYTIAKNTGSIEIDATSATEGSYEISVPILIAGSTVNYPVSVTVLAAAAPPRPAVNGAVNNATFESEDAIGRGAIVALFGDRMIAANAALAGAVPLPTNLGTSKARVYVNGKEAPLYYVSDNQINFQMPYETSTGLNEIRVERDGILSGRIAVQVVDRAPRFLRIGVGEYAIAQNPSDGTFALPTGAFPGVGTRPAKRGKVIVLYAIGLGQTSPAVQTGVAAPIPPAQITPTPQVRFGPAFAGGVFVTPEFVGLTPNFVGLYQINVRIPLTLSANDKLALTLTGLGGESNSVSIAIE